MNSSNSITHCSNLITSNDVSRGSITKITGFSQGSRESSFAHSEVTASTPKARLSHSQPIGKENVDQQQKLKNASLDKGKTRKRVLKDLKVKTQPQVVKKSPVVRKVPTRRSTAFEILRSGDEADSEKSPKRRSQGARKTPAMVDHSRQLLVRSSSPEYNEAVPEKSTSAGASGKPTEATAASDEFRELDQTLKLIQIFPDIEPAYLRAECERIQAPLEEIIRLIVSKITKGKMPIRVAEPEHKRRSEGENPMLKYLDTFSLDLLLKILPDPWSYYSGGDRDCESYTDNSCYYLQYKFRRHYTQTITEALAFHNHNLYLTYKYLMKKNRGLKLRSTSRPMSSFIVKRPRIFNRKFLLEMTFIERENALTNYLNQLRLMRNYSLKVSKPLVCDGCRDGNLLEEDVFKCRTGRRYCKKCIAAYFEICIRDSVQFIQCLGKCGEKYPLEMLLNLLRPELFSKVVDLYLIVEPGSVPELTRCPFCWFVTIMPPDVKVVTCLNPRCLGLTCRTCKRLSHAPLGCRRIGSQKEEKAEADHAGVGSARSDAIRKCWRCEEVVNKVDCCNELVCVCGGRTCHVCGGLVAGYSHFHLGEDGDGARCPLYTTEYDVYGSPV